MYVIRVLFASMALAMLAVGHTVCNARPWNHSWLFLAGVVYPHLGQLLLGRFDASRRRGHVIFMIDGLFVGAVISALDFAVVPSAVLAAISLFNWMIIGGPTLIAFGVTAILAGVVMGESGITGILADAGPACAAEDWLAGAVLVSYLLIVARVIHQLIGELRQQQAEFHAGSDAAANARALAERALLAVLPPCAAELLAEKGELASLTVERATMLLVEFDWGRAESPSLGDLTDAFQVCDMILTRHGFEVVKTFGRRVLAISLAEDGPDGAVAAAREIDNFFVDHLTLVGIPGGRRSARMVMHCGPMTLGLVQPERLNLEVLGETADGLAALAAAAENLPPATVVASMAAQRSLHDATGFVLASGDGRVPLHYVLRLDTKA
jgi:hypothetical protein